MNPEMSPSAEVIAQGIKRELTTLAELRKVKPSDRPKDPKSQQDPKIRWLQLLEDEIRKQPAGMREQVGRILMTDEEIFTQVEGLGFSSFMKVAFSTLKERYGN